MTLHPSCGCSGRGGRPSRGAAQMRGPVGAVRDVLPAVMTAASPDLSQILSSQVSFFPIVLLGCLVSWYLRTQLPPPHPHP